MPHLIGFDENGIAKQVFHTVFLQVLYLLQDSSRRKLHEPRYSYIESPCVYQVTAIAFFWGGQADYEESVS